MCGSYLRTMWSISCGCSLNRYLSLLQWTRSTYRRPSIASRVIIIHGPTGTVKSTVIPWESMTWLEEHCSQRGQKAGRVICSQQRRKVTISLAGEVQRRHGEVGRSTVGYHVSRDRRITEDTRLVYLTEAIGVFALLNARERPEWPIQCPL